MKFVRQYIYLSFFILWGCSYRRVQPKTDTLKPVAALGITYKADTLKPASVILSDTCPKPLVINIPAKAVSYTIQTKNGTKKINLLPPEPKPASFYSDMTTYTAEQGLFSTIGSIMTDSKGNLWFGTLGNGVSRYDGKTVTTYSVEQGLCNNIVTSIGEDRSGNIWFGTDFGVSRYDGKSFTTFTSAQGLCFNTIMIIAVDSSGNVWFGSLGAGVSRYDGKSFTTFSAAQGLCSNSVVAMLVDSKGKVWFGSNNHGVSCYDGKTFKTFTTAQGLCNNHVHSFVEDKNGNIWIGTYGGGVSRYDGKTFTTFDTIQGLCNMGVRCMIKDKSGNLWFGTLGGGVSRYDGKSFETFTTAQGLCGNNIHRVAMDRSGNLWFGSEGSGVTRYDGKSFTSFGMAQGLAENYVCSLVEDRTGNLWFGTENGGVSRYDGKSFTTFNTKQGLGSDDIPSMMMDRNGILWFGTYGGGVNRYDGKSITNFTTKQGLCDNGITCLTEDKNGNFWFGTYNGVSRYDGRFFTNFTTDQGLCNNSLQAILADRSGNLWFGTLGGGISRYTEHPKDGSNNRFTTFSTAQGFPNNNVSVIMQDRSGNIWFGTEGSGVCRYDGKSFITFSRVQGLSENNVQGICEDSVGNLWIGTNEGFSGLMGFRPKTLREGKDKNNTLFKADNKLSNENIMEGYAPVFEKYNFKNGYPVKDVSAMLIDHKGIIWAGTGDRLVRFDYSAIHKNLEPPNVFIQAVKVQGQKICWYDLLNEKLKVKNEKTTEKDSLACINEEVSIMGALLNSSQKDTMYQEFGNIDFDSIEPFYPVPVNFVVPYEDNNITIDFAAVEPARPYLIKYQYILEGYDHTWNPVTDKSSASFGNIHEGTYTFKLKAESPEGIWSRPITYTFKVLPPFYRTWWAYGIYVFFFGWSLYFIFHWRTLKLRKEKEQLENTVIERTAEVVKQKEEVEKKNILIEQQKTLVEEKNRDILDSLIYAKRLQDAILPPLSIIRKYFPESFVLYKPKDIVAGDFYWMERAPLNPPERGTKGFGSPPWEGGEAILIAACDCTGHGVPGAMVSVVCSNALNRTVKEFKLTEPGKILDKVRELVLETFEKSESEVQDGMDISLCCFNTQTKEIQWSGANNPLWYIQNNKLKEMTPDKQPIGKFDIPKPFNTTALKLQHGDTLYLFSDGFADQFGGPKGKKFKHKQLQEKLLSMTFMSMDKQKEVLDETIENWKGSLEQVDDILIMGIRV